MDADLLEAPESGAEILTREFLQYFRAAHEISEMEQVSLEYLILEA